MMKKSLILFLILFSTYVSYKSIEHPEHMIWSDMEGYYTYLPSLFIYGKFDQAAIKDTGYIKLYPGTNKVFTKYTCGTAILELPFFLIAHSFAKITNGNTDGKNYIYGRALTFAGLCYFWLSMFILFILGKRYYPEWAVIASLTGIALGTNLFYYTFFQPAMSHVYSFFLFSCFLYFVDTLLLKDTKSLKSLTKSWILFGLVSGLIVLTRPTNIVLLLIPIYVLYKKQDNGFNFIRLHSKYIILAAIFFLIVFIPQLLYWKHITGSWIKWSYGEEGFKYWKEPKLFRVLFDAWNGWILYSPIVVFPLFQLWKHRHDNVQFARIYLYIFAIATYIFASWWAWWFGGAFGHRSYVEFLSLLVLPFAAFLYELRTKNLRFWVVSAVCLLLCYYNLGLTYLYQAPWDGPAWTYQSLIDQIEKLF